MRADAGMSAHLPRAELPAAARSVPCRGASVAVFGPLSAPPRRVRPVVPRSVVQRTDLGTKGRTRERWGDMVPKAPPRERPDRVASAAGGGGFHGVVTRRFLVGGARVRRVRGVGAGHRGWLRGAGRGVLDRGLRLPERGQTREPDPARPGGARPGTAARPGRAGRLTVAARPAPAARPGTAIRARARGHVRRPRRPRIVADAAPRAEPAWTVATDRRRRGVRRAAAVARAAAPAGQATPSLRFTAVLGVRPV